MKTKSLFIALMAALFVLTVSSCDSLTIKKNDRRIDAFEKAIINLDQNHSSMTDKELEKAIQKCDEMKEQLKDENVPYTVAQRDRIDKLCSRYWVVRAKVKYLPSLSVSGITE